MNATEQGALSGAGTGATAGATLGPWGAIIGGIGGAVVGGVTANQAANQLNAGQAQARSQIQQGTQQAAAFQQPYYQSGLTTLNNLTGMVNSGAAYGQGGFGVNPYNYQMGQAPGAYQQTPFSFQQDPGYQFQLQQGLNSVQNSAAAGGGLLSGATMQALQKYGTGLAAQDYNNAYQRYILGQQLGMGIQNQGYNQYAKTTELGMGNAQETYNSQAQQANAAYGRMNQLAGYGENAARNLSGLYGEQGQSLASSYINQGANTAAGTVGIGNAVTGGLKNVGQATDYFMNQNNGGNQPYQYSPQQSQSLANMGFNYNPNSNSWQQNNMGQGAAVPQQSFTGPQDNYAQGNSLII